MPVSTIPFPTLLFSIVVLAALLVIVFSLINRERKRHLLFDQVAPSEIAKPFPQSVTYPTGIRTPKITPETAYEAVRLAYADWLAKLLLPDQEPGQSFVRMGVEKHNLRFQVLSTSFGQALALLFSVVMAGDDLLAHQRFERLLAFCLSHPAADQAALTSWQSLPDARTARRQDSDLHAEGWIALALLSAQKQWTGSDRFNLSIVINDRLAALSAVYLTRQQLDPQPYLISSPAFLKVLQQSTNDTTWQSLSRSLTNQANDLITKEALDRTGSDSVEESQMMLQLLNYGLDALWFGPQSQKDLSGKLLQLARQYIEGFDPQAKADFSLEAQGKFGSLARIACCAPVVMAYGDQALVDQLWLKLTLVETSKFDPVGISLRLLALMVMAQVCWPLSDRWLPGPVETTPQHS